MKRLVKLPLGMVASYFGRRRADMVRAAKPGGTVAAYVWDYAGKMELRRYFGDAAITLKPEVRDLARAWAVRGRRPTA